MERRNFIKIFTAGILALTLKEEHSLVAESTNKHKIAITMDDPNNYRTPLLHPEKRNKAILEHLEKSNLKAALFVCGERVDNPGGNKLLRLWNQAGHLLANHTYSHPYYHSPKIDTKSYIADILKCEKILNGYEGFRRRFRYPFLKEGDTLEKRDSVRKFLQENGYKNGYVTVDSSDWYIDDRMEIRLKENPDSDLEPYKNFYISHILNRAEYYDSLAKQVLYRPVFHTLLIHHNLLNALFLGDLISALENNGWNLIDATEAFTDPVFDMKPDIVPAGESIIWGLARESGRFEELLRYPGEDGSYEESRMNDLGL